MELLELLEWLGRQKLRFSMILQLEPIFLAFRWIVYHPGLLSIAIRLACMEGKGKGRDDTVQDSRFELGFRIMAMAPVAGELEAREESLLC